MYTEFLSENMKVRDRSDDPGVDVKIILEWILGKLGVDWTHLVEDRDQWRVFVNTVTILGFLKRRGIF
jgi:hypothetical protein